MSCGVDRFITMYLFVEWLPGSFKSLGCHPQLLGTWVIISQDPVAIQMSCQKLVDSGSTSSFGISTTHRLSQTGPTTH